MNQQHPPGHPEIGASICIGRESLIGITGPESRRRDIINRDDTLNLYSRAQQAW